MRERTGCIYVEVQRNTGRGVRNRGAGRSYSVQYVRGVGMVYRTRWVAEIEVHRKRYRFRSTNLQNCKWWLNMMCEKYRDE